MHCASIMKLNYIICNIKLQITNIYIIEKKQEFCRPNSFFLAQNNEGDAGQSKLDNAKCNICSVLWVFFFNVMCSFNMMLIHFRSDCYSNLFSQVCVQPHFCCRAHHSDCFNVQICVVNCWCISMFLVTGCCAVDFYYLVVIPSTACKMFSPPFIIIIGLKERREKLFTAAACVIYFD